MASTKQKKEYYVYILSNKRGTLYTGVTNNLEHRIYQHKHKLIEGFTKKYNITRLVYFEYTNDVTVAIAREKQIKGMLRSKKVEFAKNYKSEMGGFRRSLVCKGNKRVTPYHQILRPPIR